MFKTIVHQTLKDLGNHEKLEREGPVRAEKVAKNYLGQGYYFWDNHFELAKWWGTHRLRCDYMIFEGNCVIVNVEEDFLDLVGCRSDQIHFGELINMFQLNHLKIGDIIDKLREIAQEDPELFPYKIVRAVDVTKYHDFDNHFLKFADNKSGGTVLSPKLIICFAEKNNLALQTYKLKYRSKYSE